MNATLAIDSLSRDEQLHLLQTLVDRLFPESKEEDTEAFPDWVMKELEEQDHRYRSGIETGDDIDVVDARLRAKFSKR